MQEQEGSKPKGSGKKDLLKDLLEANSFLDSLIEYLPNMIFVKEAKSLRFVRFNKAGEELLGLSREDLIGKNDYDFFPKEEADAFSAKDRDALSGSSIIDIPEETISTKNKGIRTLHTKKIPVFDENRQVKYLLGISEDITESKKAEIERLNLVREHVAREEAEKTIERLKFLSDASTLVSSSLDYQATLKNFSDFIVSRVADWCTVKIIQAGTSDHTTVIFDKETHKNTKALSNIDLSYAFRLSHSKLISNIDEELEHAKTDEHKEFLSNLHNLGFLSFISVHLIARGNVLGFIMLATTKESGRKYDEADLHLMEELAEKSSLAIDNARLFSDAQKANSIKDEFLATLSHELRTPLNVIQGYAEIIKNFMPDLSTKEVQDYVDAIYRNALTQANIVNDLLDVSRIITGKLSMNPVTLSCRDVVSSVVKNLKPMANKKHVEITTTIMNKPMLITGDLTRVQQIVWNLLTNAIKFTPADGKIFVRNFIDDGFCVIEIRDTGAGIEPNFLPHIFERFRQEDGSMTRGYGGLGLGLSIVRHLSELHGGYVEAQSEGKGRGSTFTVRIPTIPSLTESDVSKKYKIIRDKEQKRDLDGMQVLLIDDSIDNRNLITRMLSNYGIKVLEADSAKQARKLLKTYRPDILLCDIGMPEEDGVEFLKKLRKSRNAIPAIALTAYAREEEKKVFLSAGFQDHVAKPVSANSLMQALRKYTHNLH